MTFPTCKGRSQPAAALVAAAIGWLSCFVAPPDQAFAAAPSTSLSAQTGVSEAERQNERIAELIKDLGSTKYLVRQQAQEELRRIGPIAFDALAAAEHDRDIEIASRARYLLQLIRVDRVRDGDSPLVKRILKDYEFLDESERTERLEELASLPYEHGFEPLCRLVRFEQSPLVSKQGALLVLERLEKLKPEARQSSRKTIESSLTGSKRPGARWLLCAAKFDDDPDAVLKTWRTLVDEELASFGPAPSDAERLIGQGLQQQHAIMLYRQTQHKEAAQIVRNIIERSPSDAVSVFKLVDWLIKHDALDMVDEVAKRFEYRISSNANLLCVIAQARRAQGKEDEAEELMARADLLLGDEAAKHLNFARHLQRRGQFDWSERAYRRTIALTKKDVRSGIDARTYLAELLYDIEREYDAANVLRELNELIASDRSIAGAVSGAESAKHVSARMHYYYACHFRRRGEFDKMRKHLDQGLRADPEDADILIGMYHDPTASEARRKETLEKIRAVAEQFRNQIPQFSVEEPLYASTPYNQYAWLIANTEGDFDQALAYSHKSLELMPDTASYLDTLAHCYAAKRDFKNAVQYQSRAAELEPHTMQIQRALKRFTEELEKSEAAAN